MRPLDAGAAARLLDARYPMLATPIRQRLLDDAQGNPLALLQLPIALTPEQLAARAALRGAASHRTVERSIRRSLSRFS